MINGTICKGKPQKKLEEKDENLPGVRDNIKSPLAVYPEGR